MKSTAVVLIDAERSSMSTLGDELATTPGVSRVWSVTGDWDFVAVLELDGHAELRSVLADQIQANPGVLRTQTLVALDRYDGGAAT